MVIVMDNSQKTKNMFRFNLNKAIRERGVKQKDLAAALGMSENMISYYCNGDKVPNLVRLKEIAQHLNVSTDYLLGLDHKRTIDVSELTDLQISHLQSIINDIISANK